MADYIPGADTAFNAWQNNFLAYANANLVALGLVAGDTAPLAAPQLNWTKSFDANVQAQAGAQSARQAKDAARGTYEALIRPLVGRLQASAAVADAEKAALGITVRDTVHTPVGPPQTRPVAMVNTNERLRHIIGFADELTPTRKAKPAGVHGAEVWVKIGAPAPTTEQDLHFVALDTRTPYTLDFDGADGGKAAFYWLRWVNSRGEKGPWSQMVSATVGA